MNCTFKSNLYLHDNCQVSEKTMQILLYLQLVCCGLFLIIETIILYWFWKEIRKKKFLPQFLTFGTYLENFNMGLRPLLYLIFQESCSNRPWVCFVIHLNAIFTVTMVIAFLFFELRFIERSTLGVQKGTIFHHKGKTILFLGGLSLFLFLIGPFLNLTYQIDTVLWFWIPVLVLNFTIMPLFCLLGVIVYRKIRKSYSIRKYQKVSRHLLISVIICTLISLFTSVIGLYLIFDHQHEWILLELAWLSDIFFNLVLFWIVSKKPAKKDSFIQNSSNSEKNDTTTI